MKYLTALLEIYGRLTVLALNEMRLIQSLLVIMFWFIFLKVLNLSMVAMKLHCPLMIRNISCCQIKCLPREG